METQALYSDFGNLAGLRSEARSDADAALEDVAAQFESLFVQMMLGSMRDATLKGGLFDSHQLESYQQIYDQQLSLELSNQGGIGLAKVLVEQLRARNAGDSDAEGGAESAQREAGGTAMDLDRYRATAGPLQQQLPTAASIPLRSEKALAIFRSVMAETGHAPASGSEDRTTVEHLDEITELKNPAQPPL